MEFPELIVVFEVQGEGKGMATQRLWDFNYNWNNVTNFSTTPPPNTKIHEVLIGLSSDYIVKTGREAWRSK